MVAGLTGTQDTGIGVLGVSNSGTGVAGRSTTGDGVGGNGGMNGIHGVSTSADNTKSGVLGEHYGHGVGVSGISRGGIGVYGKGSTQAGQFDGPVTVAGVLSANSDLNVAGTINAAGNVAVAGDITLTGSDCAEEFEVSLEIEPGSVVVMDESGRLAESTAPYDRKVAGVISGAGHFRPAVIMGSTETSKPRAPLALSGRVYCRVDASYGSIQAGDLLTTSPTRGCAMRASDPSLAFGAVIGKAMSRFDSGVGLIPILVGLQ